MEMQDIEDKDMPHFLGKEVVINRLISMRDMMDYCNWDHMEVRVVMTVSNYQEERSLVFMNIILNINYRTRDIF